MSGDSTLEGANAYDIAQALGHMPAETIYQQFGMARTQRAQLKSAAGMTSHAWSIVDPRRNLAETAFLLIEPKAEIHEPSELAFVLAHMRDELHSLTQIRHPDEHNNGNAVSKRFNYYHNAHLALSRNSIVPLWENGVRMINAYVSTNARIVPALDQALLETLCDQLSSPLSAGSAFSHELQGKTYTSIIGNYERLLCHLYATKSFSTRNGGTAPFDFAKP